MFLPGAQYFAAIFLVCAAIITSVVLGVLSGAITYRIPIYFIHKTEAHLRYVQGRKNSYRWRFQDRYWFFITTFISWLIAVYCMAGPVLTLLKALGGS